MEPRQPSRPGRRSVLAALGTAVAASLPVVARSSPDGDATPGSSVDPHDADPPAAARPDRAGAAPEFDPASVTDLEGASEAVVDRSGTVVYVALRSGFATIDVSDPGRPAILAERRGILDDVDGGPMSGVFEVTASGDRLLVAGPNGGRAGGFAGFALYDVSDPAAPERVAVRDAGHPIHNADLAGDLACVTGTGLPDSPLVLYDVGGDDPTAVGRFSPADAGYTPDTCHDVYVQDGTAYVAYWDAGTWLLDVDDPARPRPMVRLYADHDDRAAFDLPGNSHYVQPSPDGDLIAVGKEAFGDGEVGTAGGPGGVQLWERTGRTDAELRTVLRPPVVDGEGYTAHNLGWRDRRLYTSWYGGGVRVYDCTDPAAPRLLSAWSDPSAAAVWTAKPIADGIVASSFYDPSLGDGALLEGRGAAVYAFPEPGGDGEPAATMDPVAPVSVEPIEWTPPDTTTGTRATSGTRTDGTGTAGTPATTTASATPPEGTTNATATDAGPTPSVGILGTVAALGAGAAARYRRRSGDDG